jgi:hypothetical protein
MKFLSNCYKYKCKAFAFPYKDTDISLEFFQKAFSEGGIEISFGIGGLRSHLFLRNFARFSMERTDMPAVQILSRQFGRTIWHKK